MLVTETRTEFARRMATLPSTREPAAADDDDRIIDLRDGVRDGSRLALRSAVVMPTLAAATWVAAHLAGSLF
ncbi:MAG TPA: hypothetical protein VM345_08155 [Acidimicrobiales bacterium]|jgi:hypothetical protein|nr:hypothetical protein [Acidimicrobiales bacterium]